MLLLFSFSSLGADIIYDPLYVPHLVQVLSILLNVNMHDLNSGEQWSSNNRERAPVAYIAQVIRNYDTFHYFLKLMEESHLCVVDITEEMKPQNLLPYMLSYDRSGVLLFRVSSTKICTI